MHQSNTQRKRLIDRIIRIDHAGEYAAKRIYQGQLAVLKDKDAALVKEMLDSELEHLEFFEQQIKARKVRPTLLLPLVDLMAYGLGVVTAKLGKESAMACTIAVEEAISEHYQEQLQQLGSEEKALSQKIKQFKDDEMEHHAIATRHDGTKAPGYHFLSGAIKRGCQIAIKLVKYL
jgi:ubiquinone biosynthesis monooxygenase Coq7